MRKLRRFLGWFFGAVVALGCVGVLLEGCVFAGPKYHGPVSDHFDGEQFHNPGPRLEAGLKEMIQWQRTRTPGPWRPYEELPPGPPPPTWVGDGRLRVTFINHATTLIQLDGVNVLTDPIWSERCSPISFAGPRRARPPGIRFEDLPPIHAVLVSHNHYDHLDVPTLRRLVDTFPKVKLYVGLGVAALLQREHVGGEVIELDWWQKQPLTTTVNIVSVPVQHFSARGLSDRDATLWTGYAIDAPSGKVYFAGDTGYGPHFRQFHDRLGAPRLAILPIGAYLPEWFMAPVHVSPKDAIQSQLDLGAPTAVAMHFGTFQLADDGQDQPPKDLEAALNAVDGPKPTFWVLGFGEGRDVP